MSESLVEKLRDLLDRERCAILTGAFTEMVDIATRKHDLLGRFAPNMSGLLDLHDDLQRNQALLRASIDGLREAGLRLAELRGAREGFRAYDSQGQRASVSAQPPRMERKA